MMSRGQSKPIYVISVAAELTGLHPQTLRTYEREGLIEPQRSAGNTRRYSEGDLERLEDIQRLTQEQGLNLAGVKAVLELRDALAEATARAEWLEHRLEKMSARLRDEVAAAHASHRFELVPVGDAALERWEPPPRRSRPTGRTGRSDRGVSTTEESEQTRR